MLHSLQRSEFLRPRERLHELLALQQIAAGVRDGSTIGTERLADMRTMAGQLQELLQRGLVRATLSAEGTSYVLSEAGQSRLRVLIVDLARELETLTESTRTLLRADLVPLTRAGVERVVLYPFGETAEMAYSLITGLGMVVTGIVDDSSRKWGIRFHDLQVQPPTAIRALSPDAVIVTSAVFQVPILAKLDAMQLDGVRIHVL